MGTRLVLGWALGLHQHHSGDEAGSKLGSGWGPETERDGLAPGWGLDLRGPGLDQHGERDNDGTRMDQPRQR